MLRIKLVSCSIKLPVVTPAGIGPATFWTGTRRSNPLSYGAKNPAIRFAESGVK